MYGCIIGIVFINMFSSFQDKGVYPNDINHFQYRYISNEHIKETKEVSEVLKKYQDKGILFLFEQSYYYKIVNDIRIDYFDLINTGNWGYNGSEKLENALKDKRDYIFVINKFSYIDSKQTDKVALNYVLENGTLIDEVYNFQFYIIDKKEEV